MKKLIMLLALLLFSISFVSAAYQWTCYVEGQVMPSGRSCAYDRCELCINTASGYSTSPSYCSGSSDECVYATTTPTPTPTVDTTQLLQRLEELESRVIILEQRTTALETLFASLSNLITNIQTSISSILARLTTLETNGGGNPNPTGCLYNNPACSSGYTCQNNVCVANTPAGCAYNNPACSEGFLCQNNACVEITTKVKFRTSVSNGYYYVGEIAVDTNGDTNLECFKYDSFYSSYSNRLPTIVARTMENYEVHKYTGGKIIIKDFVKNAIYSPSTSCTIPLSKYPVVGYESRETY